MLGVGKLLKTAGKFIGGRVKDNLNQSNLLKGVKAFRSWKDKDKAKSTKAPILPSVGDLDMGTEVGNNWDNYNTSQRAIEALSPEATQRRSETDKAKFGFTSPKVPGSLGVTGVSNWQKEY